MNTPQTRLLLSPNGSTLDAGHETASNHSGHSSSNNNSNYHHQTTSAYHHHPHQDNNYSEMNHEQSAFSPSTTAPASSTTTSQQQQRQWQIHQAADKKKNFNTEYKSKFKPFSEYAYNEVTDSFVKCNPQHLSSMGADCSISASRSNQDLSGATDGGGSSSGGATALAHQHQITISTHDADVFEPSNHDGNESHAGAGGSVTEPWYKEVVKRNEKANEYRFKSEVGHNSPLLNYTSTTTVTSNRSDSPFQSQPTNEPRLTSPSGNESLINCGGNDGGDSNMEIKSQYSDHQLINDSQQQQLAKVQYRFTPSSYKRDNLIAHMANNNNFNLPKEQQEHANSQHQQPRRAITAASQVRARSQSSRRPLISSINATSGGNKSAVASSKAQPASKSNHTTPIRTATTTPRPNFTMRPTNASTSKSHIKTPETTSKATSRYTTTTTTPTSANGSAGGLASKRTPIVSATATRVTPKPSSSTKSSSKTTPTSRTATIPPSASSIKKTAITAVSNTPRPVSTARPRTAAPSRTIATTPKNEQSPNKMSGLKAGKLPTTSARAPTNTRTAASSSKEKMTLSKAPDSNTAVKSIKTRKALESETAKAAAAAAAASGVITIAGAAAIAGASSMAPSNDEPQEIHEEKPTVEAETVSIDTPHLTKFVPEEQNLIFTTTEAGDMLADELAQAEMAQQAEQAASSTPRHEQYNYDATHGQSWIADKIDETQNDAPIEDSSKLQSEASTGGELFNGLAGGLVSAEDRFDSSERDYSVEINETNQQQEHNYNDEPYSIIPTTSDLIKDNKQPVESSSNEDVPGRTFEVATGSADTVEDEKLLQMISETNLSDSIDEHLEIDNNPKESNDVELVSESQNQPKIAEDPSEECQQLEQQPEEPSSNLEIQEDRAETNVPVGSSSSVPETSRTLEMLSQSHDVIPRAEITSQTDISGSSEEPDSTIPTTTNLVDDERPADSDEGSEDLYEIHKNQDQDAEGMLEVSLDGDLSKDVLKQKSDNTAHERPELSNNLTNSGDDGLVMSPPSLETNKDLMPTKHQTQFDKPDFEVQDNLMESTIHPVDSFSATPGLQKFEEDHEEITSSKSTEAIRSANNDGAEVRPASTDLQDVVVVDKLPRSNDGEGLAGESDGTASDFEVDSESRLKLSPDVKRKISQINFDDIDSDEHLKLSNNLTNSDDELILKPENLKSDDAEDLTPTPQQEDDVSDSDKIGEGDNSVNKTELMSYDSMGASQFKQPIAIDMSESTLIGKPEIGSGTSTDILKLGAASSDDIAHGEVADAVKGGVSIPDIVHRNSPLVDFGHKEHDGILEDAPENISNDGLILNPENLGAINLVLKQQKQSDGDKYDSNLMAQEDRLEGTVQLGDGTSAALGLPTSIENRVEMSTSKATDDPDMPQANIRFARKFSNDDSDEEMDIDPEEDPIGSAATLSPNVSVAEELMRFNAVKDNILDFDLDRHISDRKHMTNLTSGLNDDAHVRNNNESTKDEVESADVIEETIKKLVE